ncbi:MAG: serine protein kinase RIO [Candidatus Diapherotrites archaeon]|nr:serine protein kinase RIO [Candidatus Micrarchaeota archaeon]MBU1939173.1 serine protein kinase RIO [Candidatus Micrarchaeota archaeon]
MTRGDDRQTKQFQLNLSSYIKEEDARRIFAQVFDARAIQAIHKLAMRGLFETLEFVISTGKEAHVFRAVDKAGNFRAVKIYKIETSDFKHMEKYVFGDERFADVKRAKRDLVYAWTKKEYKNLERARKADVRVPMPISFLDNVLVMEFIGDEKGEAAPTLKEKGRKVENVEKLHETVVDWFAKLYAKAEMVHADFSEYNILINDKELVLIDCGQGVLLNHPNAKEFFERDVRNMAHYLQKLKVETDYDALYAEIKERAKKHEKGSNGAKNP